MSFKTPLPASRMFAYRNANYNSAMGNNIVPLNAVLYDGLNEFNIATYVFTARESGYYMIDLGVWFVVPSAPAAYYASAIHNIIWNALGCGGQCETALVQQGIRGSRGIYLTAGDTITLWFNNQGAGAAAVIGLEWATFLSITRVQ